jgi:hypothetical protein
MRIRQLLADYTLTAVYLGIVALVLIVGVAVLGLDGQI